MHSNYPSSHSSLCWLPASTAVVWRRFPGGDGSTHEQTPTIAHGCRTGANLQTLRPTSIMHHHHRAHHTMQRSNQAGLENPVYALVSLVLIGPCWEIYTPAGSRGKPILPSPHAGTDSKNLAHLAQGFPAILLYLVDLCRTTKPAAPTASQGWLEGF